MKQEATPTTALQRLTVLWAAGEYRKALKLAASWPRLGKHKVAIQRGWLAASHPGFCRQMDRDPKALYTEGLNAVAERYGLPRIIQDVTVFIDTDGKAKIRKTAGAGS